MKLKTSFDNIDKALNFYVMDLGHGDVFLQGKLKLLILLLCENQAISHRQNVTIFLEGVQVIWTRWRQIFPQKGMITVSVSNSYTFYLLLFSGWKINLWFVHSNRTKRTMASQHHWLDVLLETYCVPEHYRHICPLGNCGRYMLHSSPSRSPNHDSELHTNQGMWHFLLPCTMKERVIVALRVYLSRLKTEESKGLLLSSLCFNTQLVKPDQ